MTCSDYVPKVAILDNIYPVVLNNGWFMLIGPSPLDFRSLDGIVFI